MSSQVDIVNGAMTELGAAFIATMSENSEAARRASAWWPKGIRTVLKDAPWNCSTMIQPLVLSGQDTVIGWSYVYQYPQNCLKVRRVFNAVVPFAADPLANIPEWYGGLPNQQRLIQSKFRRMIGPTSSLPVIVTQLKGAYAEYTYDLQDPTLFDEDLANAISIKMAADLCHHLVGNPDNLAQTLFQKYLMTISEAKRVDRSEGQDRAQNGDGLVDTRGS